MHHKFLFTLAGIFLAVAVITPIVALAQANQGVIGILQNNTNDPSQGTGPNVTNVDPGQVVEDQTNTLILVMIIEVVFISLFIVMLYLGINHYHGQYDKPQTTAS
ncbi:MAG: hypothetical protein ACQCN3_03030 [Candidatus Bathyarchaeia archaeon]|jgi:hypothetical protein